MKAASLPLFAKLFRQSLNASLVCLAAAGATQSLALPSDREQPIHITSDNADIDDAKGIAIYRGDVIMIQGTTKLTGDIITIHSVNREIQRVISKGSKELAYYEEEQENDKGTLKAWGVTIDYNMAGDTIELIRKARLVQSGDTFTGDRIDYDQLKQVVNAQSEHGSKQNGRVQMVIQPSQNSTK